MPSRDSLSGKMMNFHGRELKFKSSRQNIKILLLTYLIQSL